MSLDFASRLSVAAMTAFVVIHMWAATLALPPAPLFVV